MRKKSKKPKKSITMHLFCFDGFCKKQTYQIQYTGQKYFFINMVENPVYSVSVYKFTGKYTPLGEHILIFNHAIKRDLNGN